MNKYYLWLITAIGFLFVSLLFFLNNPLVWPDETIQAEFSYNLLNQGRLVSYLHNDMYQINQGTFLNPPLLPVILAIWFKVLGFSIEVQRASALFFGLILLLTMLYLAKNNSKNNTDLVSGLLAWLVVSDYLLMRSARFSRPEIYVLSFSFLIYYLILQAKFKGRLIFIYLLHFLNLLIHPSALIAMAVTGIYWLLKEKWQGWPKLLALGTTVVLAVITWLLTVNFNYQALLSGFKAQALRRFSEPGFFTILLQNNGNFFAYICWFYFLSSLFLGILELFRSDKSHLRLLSAVGLLISWLFVLNGNEIWYYVFPLPFLYILIASLTANLLQKKPLLSKIMAVIIIAIPTYFNLILYQQVYWQIGGSYSLFTETITKQIPKNSTVFLSSLPDPYYGLKNSRKNFQIFQFPPLPEKKQKYYDILNKSDYVIYSGLYDYGFGDLLRNYLKKNSDKTILVGKSRQYQAQIIKLVPKHKRVY